jgi:hypothetical protein
MILYFLFFGFFFFAALAGLTPDDAPTPAPWLDVESAITTSRLPGRAVPEVLEEARGTGGGCGRRFCILDIIDRLNASNRLSMIDDCVLYFRHCKFVRNTGHLDFQTRTDLIVVGHFQD